MGSDPICPICLSIVRSIFQAVNAFCCWTTTLLWSSMLLYQSRTLEHPYQCLHLLIFIWSSYSNSCHFTRGNNLTHHNEIPGWNRVNWSAKNWDLCNVCIILCATKEIKMPSLFIYAWSRADIQPRASKEMDVMGEPVMKL